MFIHSSFNYESCCSCRMDGFPISTSIMASVPYTRLHGVSWVDDWGVHLYAHSTSNSSSSHLPFAASNRFFSCPKRTLLAASAWSFFYGCSTELVICVILSLR